MQHYCVKSHVQNRTTPASRLYSSHSKWLLLMMAPRQLEPAYSPVNLQLSKSVAPCNEGMPWIIHEREW